MSAPRLLLLGALASGVAGCSLVNDPDTSWIRDASRPPVDMGMDVEQPDAGDAGDAETGPPDLGPDVADMFVPPATEDCASPGDEDLDGFADCADTDCQGDFEHCCGAAGGRTVFSASLAAGLPADNWFPMPASARAETTAAGVEAVSGGAMFLATPVGSTGPRCVPMESGVTVRLVFRVADRSASGSFGVTLTRARAAGSEALPAELRVVVRDGRRLVVEQAGFELQSGDIPDGVTDVSVSIDLGPSVTPIGTAGLLVTATSTSAPLSDPTGPIYIEHLVEAEDVGGTSQACQTGVGTAGPGLYLALEGTRSGAALTDLSIVQQDCVSPSSWSPDRDLRTDATLVATASAIGDVGWTADASGGGLRSWYLLLDVTNGDPDAEDILFVPWAISLLYTSTGATFARPDLYSLPVVGSLCPAGMCGGHRSSREPEAAITEDGTLLVAHACERESEYGLYDLCLGAHRTSDPAGRPLDRVVPLLPASMVTGATSLRSPALTVLGWRDEGSARIQELRLFAVAEDADGRQSVVTALVEVAIEALADPVAMPDTASRLFTADDLGPIASKGIRALTVVREPGELDVFRLWFVTDAPGEATVSYALVSFPRGLTSVETYRANPVLRPMAGPLSLCRRTADEGCKIRGLSALRDASDMRTPVVRLLVSYDEPGFGLPEQSGRLRTLTQAIR